MWELCTRFGISRETGYVTLDRVSFAEFEIDCGTRELRKNGQTIRLEPQPAKVLAVLIRNAGEIVARQELVREIWGAETFVDFDQGLNYAIRRIRAALDDDVDRPRFLETLPKTGYRFIPQLGEPKPGDQGSPEGALPACNAPKLNLVTKAALVLIAVLILSGLAVGWKYRQLELSSRYRPTSIAVLPLRNLSADPQQEYFSDGMTEELIAGLAKTSGIRVISHTSVERYRNTRTPLPQVARELGVDAVVKGTVMRAGNRIRVTTQLIDARNDTHIWADSYERDLTDALVMQDALARDIVAQIQGNVLDSRVQATNSRNVPPGALDSYKRSR